MNGDEFLQAILDYRDQMRAYRMPIPWPCVVPDWALELATPEDIALTEATFGCKIVSWKEYVNE